MALHAKRLFHIPGMPELTTYERNAGLYSIFTLFIQKRSINSTQALLPILKKESITTTVGEVFIQEAKVPGI